MSRRVRGKGCAAVVAVGLVALLLAATPALAADGDLVPSFGTGGTVTAQFGSGSSPGTFSKAAVVQRDGKIVVAGYAMSGSSSSAVFVARYNTDGSPDPSFGSGGSLVFQPSSPATSTPYAGAQAVSLLPDGRILVAGEARDASGNGEVMLARLNTNGTLDSSFGGGGVVVRQYDPGGFTAATGMVLDGSDIVVVGHDEGSTGEKTLVARLNPDGSPDTTFGTGGVVDTQLSQSSSFTQSEATDVVVGPGGKLLLSGLAYNSADHDCAMLVRLNPDGSLDGSFGSGGVVLGDFGDPAHPGAGFDALALTPGGKIVASDAAFDGAGHQQVLVAQFNADGTPDSSFATAGAFLHQFGTGTGFSAGVSLAVQPNGKLLIGGSAGISGLTNTLMLRLTPSGTLDPTFGSGGVVVGNHTTTAFGELATPQSDGTGLLVGTVNDSSGASQLLLQKLTLDQAPVPAFTPPGFVAQGRPAPFSGAPSSDPDGSIISWRWSFASGPPASGRTVSHVFSAPGVQQVTLTVTDDYGLTASVTHTVTMPVCQVSVLSRAVLFAGDHASAAGRARRPLHVVQLRLRCTLAGRVTALGRLKVTAKRRHRSFRLRTTVVRVRAGASTRMTIGVPSSAIAMLKQRGRGTASLVLEPVSYSGASTFKLTVTGIRAVRR